ncbi:hypothetical protein CHS0354_025020 [Potamilus streckersoni]|uniref:Peptidase M12B domain-containing protein n=1 Tax=Potamilus streckersoni TaxID=2493646 RepID=A0AAE0SRK8_9BIVA|nr:hypothetical protein CHS0354_025020 [Potamilus streckersoni]
MNDFHLMILFCTVAVLNAGTSEFVWLRDLNTDTNKRHLDLGLSDELRFQLNRGKKSINLHLKENPHVRADTDMYVVETLPDGTKRAVKEPFTGKVESKYYHDIDNSAAFTVRCVKRANDPCARTLEGSLRIGNKYFHIVPVSDLSNVDRMYMNREYKDTPHVIQEEIVNVENIRLTNDTIIPAVDEEEAIKKRIFVNHPRALHNLNVEEGDLDKNKRATTVYGVELLVAVDPPVWRKFLALAKNDAEKAMNRVREYVSHVINGVALTYKSIKGRSFSIDITLKVITVVKKEADGPYKKGNPFKQNGMWSINDDYYLDAFADWLQNTPGIPSRSNYDAALMFTGYNLDGSSGIAYVRAVCTGYGVAIITEAGYFNTMIVASHELAHSLGAFHDESVGCPRGNMMWMNIPGLDTEYSHKVWEYSECSINAFKNTLAQKSCVKDEATYYDKNDYDNYNKLYPGQIYSPEEQCKIAFGKNSYRCNVPPPDKVCLSLSCHKPLHGYCESQITADGTPCGTGNKWCIDGLCVSKPSGVTTPKPTTTTVKGPKTPSSTRAPSTLPPSCRDSYVCKKLYLTYSHKKKFCSDLGDICCETCKGQNKCEDTDYMNLSCADIRSYYSSKSKFCSKWSKNCCASCSKKGTGQQG